MHRHLFTAAAGLALLALAMPVRVAAQSRPDPATESKRRQESLQARDQLRAEARQAKEAGKLDDAAALAEEVLAIDRELFGAVHAEVIDDLTVLAALYDQVGDAEAAANARREAATLKEKLPPDNPPKQRPARAQPAGPLTPKQQQLLEEANRLMPSILKLDDENKYTEALPLVLRWAEIQVELHGDKHVDTILALQNVGTHLWKSGDAKAAIPVLEKALAVQRELLGDKHPDAETTLVLLGRAHDSIGNRRAAKDCLHQAAEIAQRAYGQDHLETTSSLRHLGTVLVSMGELDAARNTLERVVAIRRQALGERHLKTAEAMNDLGLALRARGDFAAARQLFEQVVAINEAALGLKHEDTTAAWTNLAAVLADMGDNQAAANYMSKAFKVQAETLDPKHPMLLATMNNMGATLYAAGDRKLSRDLLQTVYTRRLETLGPQHPETITTLGNLACIEMMVGQRADARKHFEQVLASRRAVLGDRHQETAQSHFNLGMCSSIEGRYDVACDHFAESLTVRQSIFEAAVAGASEADVMGLMYGFGTRALDGLASVWPQTTRSLDDLYTRLWPLRAPLLQLQFARQREIHRSVDVETLGVHQRWLEARRELGQLVLLPASADPKVAAARRQRSEQVATMKEQLERDLAGRLPEFARRRAMLRRLPSDLTASLPVGLVFVDVVRYGAFEYNPELDGVNGWKSPPSYAAFVLARGEPVKRVPLGRAEPIDDAARKWREAIVANQSSPAADELRELVWQPIEQSFAAGTSTVYLMPDGALATLPWPALPGQRPGTVLLEDYALALVPGGQLLLDQLTAEGPAASESMMGDSLLAVGGVAYDRAATAPALLAAATSGLRAPVIGAARDWRWPGLPGTLDELRELARLAGERSMVRLTGEEATAARVLQELPRARWAALATHGFFADPTFRSAFQLDQREFEPSLNLATNKRTTVAGRNPLLLSGLVLAGANLPRQADSAGIPQGDGGILTAEAIAGLDLSRLELAVLSACETGLGDVAGGEGVFGLQRAFHIAGCRNVVASLWKIDDHATQTLMARFYRNLWQKNLPPLDALREAQLAMYYGYEPSTGQLSRGQGELVEFDSTRARPMQPPDQRRAAPRYWAAFMLSGAGR